MLCWARHIAEQNTVLFLLSARFSSSFLKQEHEPLSEMPRHAEMNADVLLETGMFLMVFKDMKLLHPNMIYQ